MKRNPTFVIAGLLIAGILLADSVWAAPVNPPIGEPIYRRCVLSTGSDVQQCTLYTVPAGKIFVLETVTAQIFTAEPGGPPFLLKITDPQGNLASGDAGVPFTLEKSFSTVNGNSYTINQMVKFYYKKNKAIQALLLLPAAENFNNEVSISGYLVDK